MKIRAQKREGNRVFIEVEEDFPRFQESYAAALAEAGREIRLPGFRPGKAPRELVERALDPAVVEQRAAQKVIADLYPEIIDAAKIDPVDYPDVEIAQQEKEKPFVFKLTVDVYPEVKLGKYKGVKVEKKSAAASEEEVLKLLGRLQERYTTVNAEGKKERLPLDDDFAKKVSSFGTLAELKEEVRKTLEADLAAGAEADLKNRAIAAVAADTKVEIPPAMVEREIDIMLDELRTSLAQSNLTLEDYLQGAKKEEKNLREEMKKAAEIRVKGKIVLNAVAKEEKITVTPDEIKAEIKAMVEVPGQEAREVEEKLSENARKFVEDYLRRKKALEFVIAKANIKEEGKK